MTDLLTRHAIDRARTRNIPNQAIEAAIDYGKHRAIRGADIYTIGWREVRFCVWAAPAGSSLPESLEKSH